MSFKPLGKRVLIKRDEGETKTPSGIIIADTAKEKPSKGKVVEISKAVKEECTCINVGDVVLFNKYQGDDIKIDNEEYVVIEYKDILGVIK